MNVIDKIEKDQMEKISAERTLPEFGAGDTLKVDVKIVEGDKERVQAFEGLCIARSGGGLNENFTVRKISYGEGVERIFPIFSPKIAGITVLKRGKVRRAKLYYLRDRRGKSARIVEKIQVSKKEVKSKIPPYFYINIPCSNGTLIKKVSNLDLSPIQVTYKLEK